MIPFSFLVPVPSATPPLVEFGRSATGIFKYIITYIIRIRHATRSSGGVWTLRRTTTSNSTALIIVTDVPDRVSPHSPRRPCYCRRLNPHFGRHSWPSNYPHSPSPPPRQHPHLRPTSPFPRKKSSTRHGLCSSFACSLSFHYGRRIICRSKGYARYMRRWCRYLRGCLWGLSLGSHRDI